MSSGGLPLVFVLMLSCCHVPVVECLPLGRNKTTTTSTTTTMTMTTTSATQSSCVGGRQYLLAYTTTGPTADHFIDLDDNVWRQRLSSVTCDIDNTRIALEFKHRTAALEQATQFHTGKLFLVGGATWKCSPRTRQQDSGIIMRRVVGFSADEEFGATLTIRTALAHYDEIYDTASIRFSTNGSCTETEKHICLPFNSNCGDISPVAIQPIDLYSNAHFGATCSNCFARLDADVFAEIEIKGSKLHSMRGGLRNITLQAGIVVDVRTQGKYGASIDKILQPMQPKTLMHFKVGPVPFELRFEMPVRLQAEFDFAGTAEATCGTTAKLSLDEISVSWEPNNHWSHSTISTGFAFAPVLGATSGFEASALLSLAPSFNMHFDRLFTFSSVFVSVINADLIAQEDLKPIPIGGHSNGECMEATFDLALKTSAELGINIPFANIERDWSWGPVKTFEKNGTVVPRVCRSFG